MHNAPYLGEPCRVERVGHLNHSIFRPVDLESEPCGAELNKPEPEVTRVDVGGVRPDIANAAAIILELALNEQVGLEGRR